ncbi:ABC transporter permease [Actinobacteria bacterium YIM 96077]|uniref:ABC transmembrane type-2 domain-containing protein n=1 Tax=Phytoactinopolyspora halophila TaxID=1981511 RepID=A0A329R2Z7_9ACTN|nr:ABC transporter permease [Phytoactinopolyspora halophila]AYY12013.1 ABC transporter permease [Actinobacteria bacterium YIM 96077]RAW18753.1 hypothetical protein DPM12_01405 [Phytoactinopolyspora halophila]
MTRNGRAHVAPKVWTMARYNLVRMFRERINLFFVFIFPVLIIAVLGVQFGEDNAPEVGVAGTGEFVDDAAERLEETGSVEVRRTGVSELEDLVAEDTVTVGVVAPDDASQMLRDDGGVQLRMLLSSTDEAAQIEGVVTRAFESAAVVPSVIGQLRAASGAESGEVAEVVGRTAEALPDIEIERVLPGGEDAEQSFGFEQIAAGMLLLMTFLNTLTGAAALIQSRTYGVSRRMLASPTSVWTIVLGEGAGRWFVGLFQAVYIIVVSAVLFGVEWGDLVSVIVLITVFALVAAGAAMLVGALMHNDEQAAGVTVMIGLGLGALGGTMLPLELFSSTMRAVAHATPHSWALEAFTEVGRRGGTIVDILPQLGVLLAFAVVFLGLAAWRLRVTLTRA